MEGNQTLERLVKLEENIKTLFKGTEKYDELLSGLSKCIHEMSADMKVLVNDVRNIKDAQEGIIKRYDDKIDSFGPRMDAKLDSVGTRFDSRLGELDSRTKTLEQKPAKKWESVTAYIFTASIAGVLGFVANYILS